MLAMRYRYLRDGWHIYAEPRETALGFKLVGNKQMEEGIFEPDETNIVKQLLPYVDVVINVGANIGYYCCFALSAGKYVVAFEPLFTNAQHLLRNVAANGWDTNIEVYPVALSNTVGAIKIYGRGAMASLIKGWANTPEEYYTLVPCTTMNNVLGERFCNKKRLIIVDIEGAERFMLEGASILLNDKSNSIWFVEISITEHQPKSIKINPHLSSTFHAFWNAGYEARTADRHYRLINPDEIENIVLSGIDTIRVHNFIFIEKGQDADYFKAE